MGHLQALGLRTVTLCLFTLLLVGLLNFIDVQVVDALTHPGGWCSARSGSECDDVMYAGSTSPCMAYPCNGDFVRHEITGECVCSGDNPNGYGQWSTYHIYKYNCDTIAAPLEHVAAYGGDHFSSDFYMVSGVRIWSSSNAVHAYQLRFMYTELPYAGGTMEHVWDSDIYGTTDCEWSCSEEELLLADDDYFSSVRIHMGNEYLVGLCFTSAQDDSVCAGPGTSSDEYYQSTTLSGQSWEGLTKIEAKYYAGSSTPKYGISEIYNSWFGGLDPSICAPSCNDDSGCHWMETCSLATEECVACDFYDDDEGCNYEGQCLFGICREYCSEDSDCEEFATDANDLTCELSYCVPIGDSSSSSSSVVYEETTTASSQHVPVLWISVMCGWINMSFL